MVASKGLLLIVLLSFISCQPHTMYNAGRKHDKLHPLDSLFTAKIISTQADSAKGIIFCAIEIKNIWDKRICLAYKGGQVLLQHETYSPAPLAERAFVFCSYKYVPPKKYDIIHDCLTIGPDEIWRVEDAIYLGEYYEKIDSIKIICKINGYGFSEGKRISSNFETRLDSTIFRTKNAY